MSGVAPPARATELVLNTISFRSGSTAAATTSTQKFTRILTYVTPRPKQAGCSFFFINCFYHTLCVGTHIVYVYHFKCACMTIHVHTCLCYNTIYTVTSRRGLNRKKYSLIVLSLPRERAKHMVLFRKFTIGMFAKKKSFELRGK